MSVVIGFNWPSFHDSSSCAIVDGVLVFATEEERYSRNKHSINELPVKSLIETFNFINKKYGIKPNSIDTFAINFSSKLLPLRERYDINEFLSNALLRYTSKEEDLSMFTDGYKNIKYKIKRVSKNSKVPDSCKSAKIFLKYVLRKIGFDLNDNAKIFEVPHHLAHAASAYYFSGFNNSAVISIDGEGETKSTVVWKVHDGEFEILLSLPARRYSLGYFYEAVSTKMGFGNIDGPGKVMGLAAYGSLNKKIFSRFKMIKDKKREFSITKKMIKNSINNTYKTYDNAANFVSSNLNAFNWDHNSLNNIPKNTADLAFCLQLFIEKELLNLVNWTNKNCNEKYLALAGGVALNSKANMEIYYSKLFKDLFIFPAANDAGTSIGAAAYVSEHILNIKMKRTKLESVSLGPEYQEDMIKKLIQKSKLNAEYIGDDATPVANLINKDKIIMWYAGRSELGPRALGNRSIIANPKNKKNFYLLNQIKGREWWRPLAPSVIDEDMEKFFITPTNNRFMVMMFKMKKFCINYLPAICHLDNTSRPQAVNKNINPLWYNLIKSFKENSGDGIIINTSFNINGEPIVETPTEAIKNFSISGSDAIYLNGWLLKK